MTKITTLFRQVAALTLLSVLFAGNASATIVTETFDVHANNHVWNEGQGVNNILDGNPGLATGITFEIGEAFMADVVNAADTWNYCVGGSFASCVVNANGQRSNGTILGNYTDSGYSFAFGTLVGRVGDGDFFEIGTAGFDGVADAAGELFLYHWDHNTNNGGVIATQVTYTVPAPSVLILFGLGLLGLAVRRSK